MQEKLIEHHYFQEALIRGPDRSAVIRRAGEYYRDGWGLPSGCVINPVQYPCDTSHSWEVVMWRA